MKFYAFAVKSFQVLAGTVAISSATTLIFNKAPPTPVIINESRQAYSQPSSKSSPRIQKPTLDNSAEMIEVPSKKIISHANSTTKPQPFAQSKTASFSNTSSNSSYRFPIGDEFSKIEKIIIYPSQFKFQVGPSRPV